MPVAEVDGAIRQKQTSLPALAALVDPTSNEPSSKRRPRVYRFTIKAYCRME
jgi:hypothetical protein